MGCCKCCSKVKQTAQSKKLFLGFIILLIVVILWVASSELTKYIFDHQAFDKPFFTTYTKTILFMSYFIGFLFYKPWQLQCGLYIMQTAPRTVKKKRSGSRENVQRSTSTDSEPDERTKINPTLLSLNGSNYSSRSSSPVSSQFLTDPSYENMTDDDASMTGSEIDVADRARRRVTFNKIREIRHLSDKDAEAALFARLSYSSLEDLQEVLNIISNRVPLSDTIRLALAFCVLWMCGSFFYQEALAHTSAAATNILSSTSGFFTLILSAIFRSSVVDNFSLSKLLAVAASIGGITLVSFSDPSAHGAVNYGAIFALLGALAYAMYLVMLTKKVGKERSLDIPLFFGFVGLFAAMLFWPMFFILHHTGVEKFELPPDRNTWLFIVVNGILGTCIAELLWLWGCFLTSSLIGTLALGLVTPITMAWDMCFNKLTFSWMFIGGTIPVFLSFFAVSILGHYGDWDPVLDFLKWMFGFLHFGCKHDQIAPTDGEQRESLMDNEVESSSEIDTISAGR
eukprot:Seg1777.6 transcript_id=Seg1777.6/GoldUCD/mRNA.D3Y31 product="Solute carrier family 35 member F5" protein_id=Seg1777.6/GoldUCD/D3Y31